MAVSKIFNMVLRCYHCGKQFHLRHLSFDKILSLPLVAPCPHCGSRPYIAPGPRYRDRSKLHRVSDLREAESIFRKTQDSETWHFSQSCSNWPEAEFIQLEALPRIGALCNECKFVWSQKDDH